MASDLVLGFDFGLNHIGVSVGTLTLKQASALKALKAKDGIAQKVELDRLFDEYRPVHIVVGMPLNMDGSMQDMSFRARKFGNRLANNYKVRVFFLDERLSSCEAKDMLFSTHGFKGLKKKDNVDAMAAAVILQSYFDSL